MTEEVLEFQAEAKDLLHLVIHSLYTSKDIFLRELISNASDALDRLRFESLTRHDLISAHPGFEIRLDVDPAQRTLTISDSGIGMTRDELVSNIGTIARSATRELRRTLGEVANGADLGQLIGQFGVGFYSAFMVAERVRLVTRRAGETQATEWESTGGERYTVRPAEKATCGTSVTLHLKAPAPESGIEDYASGWWLTRTVKKYSDFVRYPVILHDGLEAAPADAPADADAPINAMKPLWKRRPGDITPAEYAEFYRQMANDWTDPIETIHFKADGVFQYDALLYVPAKAPSDLYYVAPEVGLTLYANAVVIEERSQDLLPAYLRFVRGVVDVGDLPLNISRQRLQQDHNLSVIRKGLTRKVLTTLQKMLEKERTVYETLWREFGRAIKEGVSSDFDSRDALLDLTLFSSSHDADALFTLAEYVGRMRPEQKAIFYLTGESRATIDNSPHLEAFKQKGYEVLYMTDPSDELLLQYVSEFRGTALKSAGKGTVSLGTDEERAAAEAALAQQQTEYQALLAYLQDTLQARVKRVRLSSRLTDSPACLVVDEHEDSPLLERVLQK